MDADREVAMLLIASRPNVAVILKALYQGVPMGSLDSIVPEPERLDEDMALMVEAGMLRAVMLGKDETVTVTTSYIHE